MRNKELIEFWILVELYFLGALTYYCSFLLFNTPSKGHQISCHTIAVYVFLLVSQRIFGEHSYTERSCDRTLRFETYESTLRFE